MTRPCARIPRFDPIVLNGLTIPFPVALGPMAGVTDRAFRKIAAREGCGLFYTEMVSAKALYYKNENTKVLLIHGTEDRPLGVQLFGNDPDIIADEAVKLEEEFDFIDFNMGCPVPKVVKNGEGSALLKDPALVEKIFTKLTAAVKKPVTVKIRTGFALGGTEGIEIARVLEASGVSLIAVHGRTREQYYSGKADYGMIRKVKEAVKIPVIGNGDVFSVSDAVRLLSETGTDGVMVARGAEGNPWIFRELKTYFETGRIPERPTYGEIVAMILCHAELLAADKGEKTAVMEMRRHASAYLKGTPNAASLRVKLNEVKDLNGLRELLFSKGKGTGNDGKE